MSAAIVKGHRSHNRYIRQRCLNGLDIRPLGHSVHHRGQFLDAVYFCREPGFWTRWALWALLALGAAVIVLRDIEIGFWGVILVVALIPFATLPIDIGLTPTFLDLAIAAVVVGGTALHVIDVNSGNRSRSSSDQETNAVEVNLSAADEIAAWLAAQTAGRTVEYQEFAIAEGVDPEALAFTLSGWEAAGAARPLAFGLDVTERRALEAQLQAANERMEGELNIGRDGTVDYDLDFLMGFDWTVASVHSVFDLDRNLQTERVLQAFAAALELEDEALERSWRSLSETGNLSSASVLFVLAELMDDDLPRAGDRGVLAAMESGFFRQEIAGSAFAYQEEVDSGERTVVGVNDYDVDTDAVARSLAPLGSMDLGGTTDRRVCCEIWRVTDGRVLIGGLEQHDWVMAAREMGRLAGTFWGASAGWAWQAAVEQAGSTDLDAVIEVLHGEQFETVLGPIGFDEKGDAQKFPRVYVVQEGELVDWMTVDLYWGDERCVPPTDAASNQRLAREQEDKNEVREFLLQQTADPRHPTRVNCPPSSICP